MEADRSATIGVGGDGLAPQRPEPVRPTGRKTVQYVFIRTRRPEIIDRKKRTESYGTAEE